MPLRRYMPWAGVAGLAVGITTVALLWPPSPPGPTPLARPLLAQVVQASNMYLARHAQPWLTCPTAAGGNCVRWKTQEAAGNLIDDMGVGAVLIANGAPIYQTHTSIPDTTGFNGRRGIAFNGSTDYFDAAIPATADVTTNNFTIKGWACPQSVASGYLVSKINGGVGYDLYFNAGALTLRITDGGGTVAGSVGTWPVVSATNVAGCRNYQVRADRTGNATADFDNVNSGVNLDISVRNLTLANAVNVRIGRSAAGGATYFTGQLSEVLIANGLGTLAEMTSEYRAFKVPTASSPGVVGTLTYTQTMTRKWPCPSDPVTGARLCVFAGSATNPQWPVMYRAERVNAARGNPLGLVSAESGPTTNVIGFANELESWTLTGTTVSPTYYEAPDGSITARRITFSANAQSAVKAVVGGGVIVAGERWCQSLEARRVSGTCVGINLYADTTRAGSTIVFTDSPTWTPYYVCTSNAGGTKGASIYATTHGSCVMDIADAQYESNNVTYPCTSTTGDVSQTCNASYYTTTSTKGSLMPQSLERLEVVHKGSTAPVTSAPGSPQVRWMAGNQQAYLAEGINTALVLKSQAGGIEYLAKYRSPTHASEARDYVSSWDFRDGLTNTTPRRYGGLSVSRNYATSVYAPTLLEARQVNATIDAVTPQTQRDLSALTFYVGCDAPSGSPVNCSQGGTETFEVYGRPAQDVKSNDATTVLTPDATGAAYLQAQAIPRFARPAGALPANTWRYNFGESSGALYDEENGVALATTGTPRYQAWSGLLARGQGRRGIRFVGANSTYVAATTSSITSIGASTTAVSQVLLTHDPITAATQEILGSTVSAAAAGFGMWTTSNPRLYCAISDGTDARICYGTISSGYLLRHLACRHSKAATWADPVLYQDGVALATTCAGVNPTNSVANGAVVQMGRIGANYLTGVMHEAELLAGGVYSDATVLADYKQTTQRGTFWSTAAVAQYKMNETTLTNTIGVRDHSGNGNHLTTVSAITPTAQFSDMPWPAGTGTFKSAVEYNAAGNYHSGGVAAAVPSNAQPFSLCVRVPKFYRAPAADQVILSKGTANDYYDLTIRTTGRPRFRFNTSEGGLASTEIATNIADNTPKLLCAKVTYTGGATYTPYISVDGGAFAHVAGSTTTGDPSGNAANIVIGTGQIASPYMFAGVILIRDYELTDADVLAMVPANSGSPIAALTYIRTNKACYEVDNHPIEGMRTGCWGAGQVPFAYESAVGGSMGNERYQWGLPGHAAVTNLGFWSEALDSWTPVSTTFSANQIVSPDGTTTADRINETVANTNHQWRNNLATVLAQNSYGTLTAYAKGGTRRYINNYLYEANTGDSAYCIVDTTLMTHNSGATFGTAWSTVTSTITGVGGGWIKQSVTAKCVRVGGCALYEYGCFNQDTGAATFCGAYVGDVAKNAYVWGVTVTTGASAIESQTRGVYCPSPSNAATTCNASNAYVAAANLAGWTRDQGQVSHLVYSRNASGYGWDLSNAVNNNGRHYVLSQGSEGYIYNSVGVLQQRSSLANAQIVAPTGIIYSWDDTTAFYTDQTGTARRSYGRTMQGNYAGPWPTYTTDTGAVWAATAGSSLYLCADNAGGNSCNGLWISGQIYSTR